MLGGRHAIVGGLAALILVGGMPAEASAAPKLGRWVGANGEVRVSFTIHAAGGRRYIAGQVAACKRPGPGSTQGWQAATSDRPGERSFAWRVRGDGTVPGGPTPPGWSPFTGRLGRTTGTIRTQIGMGPACDFVSPIRVRWTSARPVENGIYQMTGPGVAFEPQFFVAGGAAVVNEFVSLHTPAFNCSHVTAFHAWIEPDGALADVLPEVSLSGRLDGPGASGTYVLKFCDNAPHPWTAQLVKRQPLPRVLEPAPPVLPAPAQPVDYVALGDSYSSGEGVPPFEAGTDTRGNRCHRSTAAYSRRFALPRYRFNRSFFACSGAVTDNVGLLDAAGQIKGKVQYPSEATVQVQRLSVADWSSVDMVSLTIGGNDARFGPVLQRCLVRRCHRGRQARQIIRRIGLEVPPKLAESYAAIAGRAPNATTLVLGYPQLFPGRPQARCAIGKRVVSRAKQAFLRRRGIQLNRVIRRRAGAAGFHFVAVDRIFGGHEPCGPKAEWIHALVRPPRVPFSFHPNRAGQAAYTRALRQYFLCLAKNGWPFLPSGMPESPRGRPVPSTCA